MSCTRRSAIGCVLVVRAVAMGGTTVPTAVAADMPGDCVGRFVAGIEAGDVAAVADRVSVKGDTPDGQLRWAIANAEVANGRLWKLARDRFGDGPALGLARHTGTAIPDHRAYLGCEWEVEGNRAVGRVKASGAGRFPPIRLAIVDGRWKYAFPGAGRPEVVPRVLEMVRRQTAEVEALAKGIEEGRYRSAEEAEKAYSEAEGRGFGEVGAGQGRGAATRAAAGPVATGPMGTVQAVGVGFERNHTVDRLAPYFWAEGDGDGKLARAVAGRVLASRRLVEAYVTRFPREAPSAPGELGVVVPGDFFSILLGEWREEGDRARFVSEEGIDEERTPVGMRRVEGKWKFDVTPVGGESVAEAVGAVTKQTAGLERVAGELKGGKIRSVDEFNKEMGGVGRAGVRPAGRRYLPEVVPGR